MRGFLAVSLVVVSFILDGCGGCGDDSKGGSLADAPPLIDTAPDMMVPQAVTLTVSNLGQPVAGVRVYFVNADDSLVKAADTDASGNASAVMDAGGSVTAINPFIAPVGVAPTPRGKGVDQLRTFLGVKPGDHLFLTQPLHESVTFQLVASPTDGANTYDLFSTCGGAQLDPNGGGSGNPGLSLDFQDCHGGADFAIIASFNTTESHDPVSGLYHPDATLATDQTVNLSADTYAALATIDLSFPNAPETTLVVQHGPLGKHGVLGPFGVNLTSNAGSLVEPAVPTPAKAVVDVQLTQNSQHEVVDWGAYTTTYTLDMQNLLLAEITSVPSFDKATDKMQWGEADTGGVADLTLFGVFVTGATRAWHWSLAAAHPATTEIKLPVLPTDVFDWNPKTDDGVTEDAVINFKVPGGYDAVRGHIFDIVEQGSFRDLVAGDSGRALSVTSLVPR